MRSSTKHLRLHIVMLGKTGITKIRGVVPVLLTLSLLVIFTALITSCSRLTMNQTVSPSPELASTAVSSKQAELPPPSLESSTPVSSYQATQISSPEPSLNVTPSVSPKPTPTPKPSPTATAKPTPSHTPTLSPEPVPEPVLGIVYPYVPYTYEQMIAESQKLAEKYPDILSLGTLGSSVEERELLLIKLGVGEKKIVLCGTHHAREYISSSYLMKMTEEYARAYTETATLGNYNVKDLLSKVTLYIVPMVNPDGVNLVNSGLKAVKDQEAVKAMALVRPTYREWKANINGVDLNRHYPAYWQEKYDNVGKPASENYKGTDAATEPEVQAMMNFSWENDFILAASFHTKGNTFYWADKGTVELIPGAEAMSKRLSTLTKYRRMPISEKPSVYGAGYENWFRLEFKRPAFCIELTPYNKTDVPHDDKKFDSLVWKNAKFIGLFLADEALKR